MGSIFPYESEFVITERISIGDIPCLKFRPKGAEGLVPTIIYYHGWRSNKENQRLRAEYFQSMDIRL